MAVDPNSYLTGTAIRASKDGVDLPVTRSNIRVSCNLVKVTNRKTVPFSAMAPAIKSATGTITLVFDANATFSISAGDYIILVVGVAGGPTITGGFYVGEVTDDANVDSDYTITASVSSSGSFSRVIA